MEPTDRSEGCHDDRALTVRSRKFTSVVFGVCFFVSGATGLIYENVWMRILGLHFGNTALAVSAVLTAFMAGLALGSYVVGSRADRMANPLRVYAIIELAIGACCLATPYLLDVARGVYFAALGGADPSTGARTLLQLGLCLVVLLVPTALMGATLPILSAGLQRSMGTVSRTVGNLYAINTFGAVAGTMLTAFILLEHIGVHNAVLLAAALNGVIGLVLLGVTARGRALPEKAVEEEKGAMNCAPTLASDACEGAIHSALPADAAAPSASVDLQRFLLRAFFLAGFSALACEVIWTRVLCMVIGSSVYAFAVILTAFLMGIALGSFVFARFWGDRRVGIASFAVVEASIGLLCIALTAGFTHLPGLFLRISLSFAESEPSTLLGAQLAAALLFVAPPTLLMGLTFPLVTKILTDAGGPLGSSVGRAYAANTAGAILGSALSSLLLVPLIGMRWTILGAGLLYVLIGIAALKRAGPEAGQARRVANAVAVASLALILALPPWSRSAFAYGVFQSNVVLNDSALSGLADATVSDARLVFYEEGPSAVVSVVTSGQDAEGFALAVNGKVDASTSKGDMATQVLTGHLPALLASDPRRMVLIGLGSGISASSMARHPSVESVTCVEIEPNVGRAARAHFGHLNDHILDPGVDPRFSLVVDDGRSYIERAREPFDVIVSEPSNPWLAGVGNLYTVEFYEQCRAKLTPGGIMTQWVQLYSLNWQTVRMILRTFSSVFPHVTVFHSTRTDLLLVGSPTPIVLNHDALLQRLAALPTTDDLAAFGLGTPGGLTSAFLLSDEDLRAVCEGADINTDDRPLLEFRAPRSLYAECAGENFSNLRAARSSVMPPPEQMEGFDSDDLIVRATLFRERARGYTERRDPDQALVEIESALSLDPGNPWALIEHGCILTELGLHDMALLPLRRAEMLVPAEPEVHYRLHVVLLRLGIYDDASSEIESARELQPENEVYQKASEEMEEIQRSTEGSDSITR